MGTFYISANTLSGGGDEIVDAFYDRLNEEGVDIFCGDAVVGVEVDEGRHIKSVITANGKVFECDSCICTIHPGLLSDILPKKAVRPAFFSRIRSMEETPAAFALYLELDDVPAKSTHTNHFSLGTRDNYNDGAWLLVVMACGPGSYDGKKKGMCVIKKGDMALGGREFYGYPKRTNEYLEYKRSETEKILKELYAFYPELAGNGKVVCAATPYTFERYTGTLNGSMYGIKQSVDQIKLNSPTHIKGFYLAGQSILVPGVFGSAVSGLLAVANIMGIKDVWRELKKWS
jgi:all-trans-retinol 13,14-reductase